MPRFRRPVCIAALTCAVALPALTGCEAGLDAPTLAYHQAGSGAYATQNDVTISNAFILGPGVGQQLPVGGQAGVFVSISSTSGDQLVRMSADGTAASVTLVGGTVDIPANGAANLTGPTPQIVLTNLSVPLSGGQNVVTLKFQFANAGQITVQAPVEPQAYAYATYQQPPAPAPTPTPTPTPATSTAAKHAKNNKKQKNKSAKAKATVSPAG